MLVNIIQNTISSFRSALAAAEVITTNLKMWLGFETSETLGREEVVNGDFATDSVWVRGAGWTITNGKARNDGTAGDNNLSQGGLLEVGKSYQITIEVSDFVSGEVEVSAGGSPRGTMTANRTYTFNQVANGTVFYIIAKTFNGSVGNVSVKELTQITPDKSGNNNVGELFTGKALEFNGSTTYVSANSFAGTLSNNTAFTFAIWFNSDKIPTDYFRNILISSGGPQQFTNIFKIGVNPQTSATGSANVGGIYFDDSAGGYNNVVPSSGGVNYNDGEWHRLVVSRPQGSGNQTLTFYVDGSSIGTAPCNPYWNNVNLFDFGQEWDGAGTSDHFGGMMSNIQVYDYAWTTDDVTFDYANPQNLVTDRSGTSIGLSNLKGYWHLSEGAGSVVYDSSGEGNNGTINGATYEPAQPRIPQLGMMNFSNGEVATGVTLIPNPNNTSEDIDGNLVRDRLNSFNLDGSGYAEVADADDLDFGTGAFTMECWVKADFEFKGSSINVILSLGGSGSGSGSAALVAHSTNKLGGYVNGSTLDADSVFTIGDWYHVAITRNGSGLCTLYVDSVAQTDTETNQGNITNSDAKLIGRDTGTSRFYKNLISDVRLYDRALSVDEVENNYNAGLSAHTN